MINLSGSKREVRLKYGDVMEIEEKLKDIKYRTEGLPESDKKDIDRRINEVEFIIQRNRTSKRS